jgi:esterase/lipase superfamily enzyme
VELAIEPDYHRGVFTQHQSIKRCVAWLGVVWLAALMAGCAGGTSMRPAPVVYRAGGLDLTAVTPPQRQLPLLRVFYATSREGSGPADDRSYGNDPTGRLALGEARVHLGGPDREWKELADPTSDLRFQFDRAAEVENAVAFCQAINRRIAETNNREVNLYVHGFRTNLEAELEILAKLSHFSGRGGAMVCFSWPARQQIVQYAADVDRAKASGPLLADLIELLARETTAEHINLLSYSCGSVVTMEAVAQLAERLPDPESRKQLRVGNVVLAASDLDLKTFAFTQLKPLISFADDVVMYVNDNDLALGFVGMTHHAARVGRPNWKGLGLSDQQVEELARFPRVQVIDAATARGGTGSTGHGYWYTNAWVLTDILVTLRWQLSAEQRGLERKPGGVRWQFPRDYPDRALRAVYDAHRSHQNAEPEPVR